ncbi:hypothetical protein IMSHALPRED_005407 [Imshaugia aleurites]|uniref:AMP-dependent synthetase/ligase domain-containing protein n=1 Tax=Imshaugia aleurites TaxID=172621 RepID=A0A8H3EJL0_9LECA|nr:hypothetical protein IMSHALPRED_005407 [Imshaugia aleurites]
MSAHTTGYAGNDPGFTEPREQSFASTERQLILEVVPGRCQLQIILASAWAVLLAAFSEENDVTVDFLNPNTTSEIALIHLHLGAEQSIKDVQGELQRRLHRGLNGSKAETLTGTQKNPKKRPILPKTIIASEMDDGVRFLKSDYVMAITCQASTSNDRSLVLRGNYNSRELDDRDSQNVLDRIGNLITQFGAGRDQKVEDFNLMCTADKEQLGVWNNLMTPSFNVCVQDLIELQSRRCPSNEAVCAWDGSFTYEELDRRATVLAEELVARGVSLGSYVPLMFEKSKWHIVSLLAVRNKSSVYPINLRI